MSADVLKKLGVAFQEMQNHGWTSETKLEVKIAGTLKNDKFIVIKPVKEKLVSNPDPTLKQKHIYKGEQK